MRTLIICIAAMGMAACTASEPEEGKLSGEQAPGNIILLIGDGMGLPAVSAGFYYRDTPSVFTRFPHIGMITTHSATHKVTDSAASGTAMSSGAKTYNGAIGVDTAQSPVQNITEIVSGLGWSTGLVSTSSITHATPASFYAHVVQRRMEEEIAEQLLDSEIDFFAGGGLKFFARRSDERNLLEEATGWQIDTTALPSPGGAETTSRQGYLLAGGGMPGMNNGRGDFLPQASTLALEHLSSGEKGFFLMVESSQIDWAGHANDADWLIGEMLDFEKTIEQVLRFAEEDGNTLVVVTADHETGGFALSGMTDPESGNSDYRDLGPAFATGGHTATLIPVFAYGPGAEAFTGIFDNTGLFRKMKSLVGE